MTILQPIGGYEASVAYGVSGGQQVGYALTASESEEHAGAWTGSPESWVDLNPVWASESRACCASDGYQAGGIRINGPWHAGMWSGTAESWVDLSTLLPAEYRHSVAWGIEVASEEIWVVGWAWNSTLECYHAILWHRAFAD